MSVVTDNGELIGDTAGQRLSVSTRCDLAFADAGPTIFDNSTAVDRMDGGGRVTANNLNSGSFGDVSPLKGILCDNSLLIWNLHRHLA